MGYKVLKDFKDLQDDGYIYRVGDSFPRPDVNVEENRILELSTNQNKRGEALIKKVSEDAPAPKKRGRKPSVRTNPPVD